MSSGENFTIETPEQTSLDFSLAGIGSRFLALAGDLAIQFVVGFVLFIAIILLIPAMRFATPLASQWLVGAFILGIFLLNSGYFAFFETIWNGQTPGKRFAQIRVIKDDGRPVSAYDAIARNLLRVVDEMPGLYAVGVISILFSKRSKRLGDYVAGTVVVHEKKIQEARPFFEAKTDASFSAYDMSLVTLEEFNVIETFLNRRDSFDPSLRTTMAAKIARRMSEKLGASVAGWPQTEKFLEAIYEQFRSTGRFHTR